MDDLRTTLLTLGPDERRDFGVFIQRQRRKAAGRQDSRLYELLVQPRELAGPQLIATLYPGAPNPVAYYALRKRLLRHLTDFLLLRQRQLDTTAAASVRGQLTLAQYLFEAGIPRLAWSTLRKAEKLARDNEQYEPLNAVYNLQIQYANSPHAEPLPEIIARRHVNKKAADEEERANIADSLLRQRLREARKKGRAAAPLDAMMHDILAEYDLQEAFARSPSLLCRLMSIARSAMLVRRDFATFAVYIERCYRLMERRHGFAPAQRSYQLRLLYMLAHALYRSRHFAQSIAYLEQGRALLQASSGRKYAEFVPRFTFLLAANLGFIHRNPEGIDLLEQALKATPALPLVEELTARLQLVFHYFAEGNFSKANQALLRIGRTDHWLEEQLGLEWLLNKNMAEMFIQLELGHEDIALCRLKAIERSLREQFPAEAAAASTTEDATLTPTAGVGLVGGPYRYILSFLELVHDVINDPAAARRPAFAARVADLPTFLPLQREDLQALSFYAWLRARMLGRPYYEVLLEVAGL
ncbi:hypothetical protein AUC43_06285 [Hymenobacter sedentarius]|uniref:Uncharacterized protein n=1 Tax=Hymenobacter sedentarius TaxID=1411621 RepID=A0A0U4AMJ3_9BACT|nr:hypothetical protein [Hymenobacter sedentarius]ALW84725.1 hypothetical protein AUC43_06285 [Hymenobacter sedentarius]